MFVATTHHIYGDNDMIVELYSKIFHPKIQLGLEEAIWNIRGGLTIPSTANYGIVYVEGEEVPTYLIIFIEDKEGFWEIRLIFMRSLSFLAHYHGVFDPINFN